MQHILNIAVDFDDATVNEYIKNQAISDVRNALIDKASKYMPTNRYGSYGDNGWEYYIREWVTGYLDEHQGEIVTLAATMLAKRVEGRKAWKEVAEEAKAELEEKEGESSD